MLNKALANTEKSVKDLIGSVVDNKGSDYNIIVYFEK